MIRLKKLLSTPYESIYVAHLSEEQMEEYFQKYIEYHQNQGHSVTWTSEMYMNYMRTISGFDEKTMRSPIVIRIIAEALPQVISQHEGNRDTTLVITRTALYKQFMSNWFQREKGKLEAGARVPHDVDEYFTDGLIELFWHYSQELAQALNGVGKVEFTYEKPARVQRRGSHEASFWDQTFADNELYPNEHKQIAFHGLPIKRLRVNSNDVTRTSLETQQKRPLYAFWHASLI